MKQILTQNLKSPVRMLTSQATLLSSRDVQLSDEQLSERRRFWEQEAELESQVQLQQLTEKEKLIRECHREAVKRQHFTYNDPETQNKEFTRLRHYVRGVCCGNACRHCIYDHEKVPDIKKKGKRFNSAFWVYESKTDEEEGRDLDEAMFLFKKPKPRAL